MLNLAAAVLLAVAVPYISRASCIIQATNPSTLQPFNPSTVLYSYDAFGRLATLSTTRDDEAAGQLATDHWPLAADASGVAWDTTRWNYDESTGLLTNKVYADGLGPSYTYTPDGKLATRTWARGVVTAYAYDYAGNLTSVMHNAQCTMHNDGGGNPVNPVNPVETTYTYDRVGHMLSATVPGVSTNRYAYSIHGQLTNEIQNGVSIARTYDSLNRPTGYSLCTSASLRLNYSYDSLGRFSGVGFNAEAQRGRGDFEYSYLPGTDLVSGYTASAGGSGGAVTRPLFSRSVAYEPSRNLISAITNAFTNPSTLQPFNLSTFAYLNDALGRRVEVTRTGAAFGDLSGVTDAYGYNLRSEVVSSRRTLDGVEVRGFDYDYAYDPIGNRISATDYDEQGNPLVSSYSANALNQYTHRTVPGYATIRGAAATNATITVNERPTFRQGTFFYGGDSADNTTSNLWKELEVYAAINPSGTNTPDIVSASTGTVFIAKTPEQFTYDADGNMTSDGCFYYYWNGENRLVMASNDTFVVTYAYDHRGRMVRKEISHRGTEARRIEYLWDDWNIIRETLTANHYSLTTDYVWGLDLDGTLQGAGGVGGLLAVVHDDGVFFPTYDANGNVSEYVSTNGEVVAHYDYSPFGEPLVASGPLAATFTHRFSTKPYCAVTGFSEYQMRKYNPEIGRWMSRDPIDEIGFGVISDTMQYVLIFNDYSNSFAQEQEVIANEYGNVGNSPFASFDYNGLNAISIPWPVVGACAAMDGPLLIGDAIAVGLVGCCVIAAALQPHGCYPCDPPVGTLAYQVHKVPPHKPHWPLQTHTHHFRMEQSPWPMCKCFWNRNYMVVTKSPLPGEIAFPGNAGGGGAY